VLWWKKVKLWCVLAGCVEGILTFQADIQHVNRIRGAIYRMKTPVEIEMDFLAKSVQ
jgi:hypothetical protein